MTSTLVEALSPRDETRASQERQYSHHEDRSQRDAVLADDIHATEDMCAYCFDVLIAHFNDEDPPPIEFVTDHTCGLFVTWNKTDRGGEALRGCIGTLTPMPISCIKDYTYSSALHDRRFSPIEKSELPSLSVAVSLLVKYEPARHWEDWEVGVHGIVTNFTDNLGSNYSATFLPEVAAEQGWTKKVTLTRLVRKAGYRDAVDRNFLSHVQVTRYQSSKWKLSFQDYVKMQQNSGRD